MALSAPAANTNTDPGRNFFTITPSDSVNFPFTARGIYVGAFGDIVAISEQGVAITFKAVPQGTILPIMALRINATNTTATNLVALL